MRLIPLSHCVGDRLPKGFAMVDNSDYDWLSAFNWTLTLANQKSGGYAMRRHNDKTVYMHRVIANVPEGMTADHIDGNGLNNQRGNLRVATPAQNMQNIAGRITNTTGHKGVYFMRHTKKNPWAARIRTTEGRIYLGGYPTAELAAEAYRLAALKYHGEFARLA